MAKRALLTGITGQDGAYLSQLLLEHGYEVYGVVRRSSHFGVADHRLRWIGVDKDVHMLDGNSPISLASFALSARSNQTRCTISQPSLLWLRLGSNRS